MKKTILVIEDDNILQSAVKVALMDASFSILQALDGKTGFDMVKLNKPDLVLLDLILPAENGVRVLRNIRQIAETKDVPVFIFTLYQDEAMLKACIDLGVQGYFFKSSYSIEEIINKIKEYFKL